MNYEIDFDKAQKEAEEENKNKTRQTSIEAYTKAKESGLLSELRLKVYEMLCLHGQLTANEVRIHASQHNVNSGVFSTRFSELERMGVIKAIGTRKCSVSGHNALVWEITGDMPKKFDRGETRSQKSKDYYL